MSDLISYVAAAVALIVAVGKFRSIRPARPTAVQRHLLVALAAIPPALALAAPTTQITIAKIEPFPYTAELACDALATLSAYSVVVMFAYVIDNSPRTAARTHWHAITLALTVLVMVVLMVSSGVAFQGDLASTSASSGSLIAYQFVFLGYLGTCTVRFIVLMRRYLSRPEAQPLMRRGMLVVLVAAAVALAWMAWNLLIMAVTRFDGYVVRDPAVVSGALGATAAILLAAGTTLPTWGAWLLGMVRRRRVAHALRDITPLWRRLVTVIPEVRFKEADLTDPEDVLHRRVIEIRDIQLALIPYVAPEVIDQVVVASAASDTPDEIAVRAEAAALATAIDAYQAGQRQLAESTPLGHPDRPDLDLLVEAAWLIRVHTALRYDPIVALIAHRGRERRSPNRSGSC